MGNDDIYSEVKKHFSSFTDVVVNSGKGAQGMKFNKKMFVMFYKGQIIVKLSPNRVTELIEKDEGLSFDPGTGKPMEDRILIPKSNKEHWITYCVESKKYVDPSS